MLTSRGGTRVIADLTALGYDTKWTVMGAADIGANHQRDRIWIVATNVANTSMCRGGRITGELPSQDEQQAAQRPEGRIRELNHAGQSINADVANTRKHRCRERQDQQKYWQLKGTSDLGFDGKKKSLADIDSAQRQGNQCSIRIGSEYADIGSASWWATEPNVGRVADGVAARVDRLKAIGNGQVPAVAAEAFRILSGG
jgi:DNA (cytosine-5)-methyltransferase 1